MSGLATMTLAGGWRRSQGGGGGGCRPAPDRVASSWKEKQQLRMHPSCWLRRSRLCLDEDTPLVGTAHTDSPQEIVVSFARNWRIFKSRGLWVMIL